MKHFLRVNVYETQTLLYWILGVLILETSGHWSGWLAIGWGWFTLVTAAAIAFRRKKEMKEEIA